jgi:hypothetical protein
MLIKIGINRKLLILLLSDNYVTCYRILTLLPEDSLRRNSNLSPSSGSGKNR